LGRRTRKRYLRFCVAGLRRPSKGEGIKKRKHERRKRPSRVQKLRGSHYHKRIFPGAKKKQEKILLESPARGGQKKRGMYQGWGGARTSLDGASLQVVEMSHGGCISL